MTTDSNLPEATPQTLDPIAFPLSGSRLIEASAGTGKTFTIALLYVRLILGHSPVAATGRLLTPRDILVVTFTEAATKELRDRIRTRLTEASQVFRESMHYRKTRLPQKRIHCARSVTVTRQKTGLPMPEPWSWRRSRWMRPQFIPFTAGVTGCCESMHSTAVACLTRALRLIIAS